MEDFVNFKLAQKLKEKGFNIPFYFYYRTDDKSLRHANVTNPLIYCDKIDDEVVIAPTIYQVLKWLREEKKLHIEFVGNACGYLYIVSDIPSEGGTDRYCSDYSGPNAGGTWDKYEDCALNAIQYVLDNLI